MQLEHNGQKEEAYSLTIYKTHAKAIASGEKTVEIRSYSNKNCEMFLDPKKLDATPSSKPRARVTSANGR